MLTTILIVVLILALVGAFGSYPGWRHSAGWGYAPFGGLLGIVAIILIVWLITGGRI